MNKMIKLTSCLLVSAILFGLFSSCVTTNGEKKVQVGAILSLTGAAAPYGQDNLRGIQVAQEVINEKGGINGKTFEIDVQDSAGDPAQAVTLTQRFAADANTVAIIGPTRTGETVAVAKLLPNLQIPMMSVGSTGDWKSAGGEFNDWTFRSTRVDTNLIEPLMLEARDRFNIKRIAILYTANDDYSISVQPVYERASQMTGDADRSAQLTKIMAENPDGLILNTLSSDAPTIADQARRLGFKGRFIGTAGFSNPATWNLAGPNVLEGTLTADNFFPGSEKTSVREFMARYKKKFGADPPAYAAYAYDGVMLVAEAIKNASSNDRKSVREALGSISNFDGVLGTLTYHGKGDAEKTPIILQITNGTYQKVN